MFDPYPQVVAGAQRTTLLMVRGLQERGWQFTVATPGPGPFVDAIRSAGIDYLPLPLPPALMRYSHRTAGSNAVKAAVRLPEVWVRTARALKSRFDIAHTIDARGQILLAPAARRAGLAVVWHAHMLEPGSLVNRFCSHFADRTIVPDQAMVPGLRAARAGTVFEVHNAVPREVLGWVGRPAPPLSTCLLTLGRFHPSKGFDVLIEAVAVLREWGVAVTTRIVGPAPSGEESFKRVLEDRVRVLGLQGVVELAEEVADVYPELGASSIYVQPSRREIQPLAILEAMAAGVPVVATRVGGVPNLLAGGERGWLVEPDSPLALAETIAEVLSRADEARRRAEAARHFVRSACDPEAMVAGIDAVYRSL